MRSRLRRRQTKKKVAKNEMKALHTEARHCVVYCGGYKVANKREEEKEKYRETAKQRVKMEGLFCVSGKANY